MSGNAPDEAQIRQRMNSLGVKFVRRTLGELAELQELLAKARAGDAAAVREMEVMAHKIHGTGATFGFTGISECAGKIEYLAVPVFDASSANQVQEHLKQLQVELARVAGDA